MLVATEMIVEQDDWLDELWKPQVSIVMHISNIMLDTGNLQVEIRNHKRKKWKLRMYIIRRREGINDIHGVQGN
jgi:phage terminase large subunit GpA-like protein